MLAGSLGIEHFVSNSDHDYINFIILNNSITFTLSFINIIINFDERCVSKSQNDSFLKLIYFQDV